jgi:hypothetical protein
MSDIENLLNSELSRGERPRADRGKEVVEGMGEMVGGGLVIEASVKLTEELGSV